MPLNIGRIGVCGVYSHLVCRSKQKVHCKVDTKTNESTKVFTLSYVVSVIQSHVGSRKKLDYVNVGQKKFLAYGDIFR